MRADRRKNNNAIHLHLIEDGVFLHENDKKQSA